MDIKVIPEPPPYLDEKPTNLTEYHDVYIDEQWAGCFFYDDESEVESWVVDIDKEKINPIYGYNSKDEAVKVIVEHFVPESPQPETAPIYDEF
jgi:hypothetical protein